jgi:hypothetical protein
MTVAEITATTILRTKIADLEKERRKSQSGSEILGLTAELRRLRRRLAWAEFLDRREKR